MTPDVQGERGTSAEFVVVMAAFRKKKKTQSAPYNVGLSVNTVQPQILWDWIQAV